MGAMDRCSSMKTRDGQKPAPESDEASIDHRVGEESCWVADLLDRIRQNAEHEPR